MQKHYIFATISAFLLVGLIVTSTGLVHSNRENYRHTHTLLECNGSIVLYQGNLDKALSWASKTCASDNGLVSYNVPANQDYDPQY